MAQSKEEKIYRVLPEGRVLNSAFFVKDVFTDEKGVEGTPQYKCEVAFQKGGEIEPIIDWVCDLIREEYGDNVYVEGIEEPVKGARPVSSPFRDGDLIAEDRESRDKVADAYKNTWVIRPNTIYNAEGQDGPGGIFVLAEDADTQLTALEANQVKNGYYGRVKVSPSFYKMNGKLGMKFYLVAFQKTRGEPGDELSSPIDHRSDFTPAKGRTTGDGAGTRRGRKG